MGEHLRMKSWTAISGNAYNRDPFRRCYDQAKHHNAHKRSTRSMIQTVDTSLAQTDSETIVSIWSCPANMGKWLRTNRPSVKIVETLGLTGYNQHLCPNIGAEEATGHWLVFRDADIALRSDFALRLLPHLNDKEFHLGWPRDGGFAGFLVVKRDVFYEIGGYDTKYRANGHADDDILYTLATVALIGRTIDVSDIGTHILHSEESRVRYYGGQPKAHYMSRNAARFKRKLGKTVQETIYERAWQH